jgi:hypothetical protein
LPLVQNELLPTYGGQGFSAVAVNSSRNTEYAAALILDEAISLPTGLDIESEVFRYYRVPGLAFPLHVVVDRQGKIAHVDNGPGLGAVEAAIVAALAQ